MRTSILTVFAVFFFAATLSSNVMAKPKLKRVDIDLAKSYGQVAMALETYDGEFYDLSEFVNVAKLKGNIGKLQRKDVIKLKNGDELDVSSVRYLFVTKKPQQRVKLPSKSSWKMPADEE
jgi:hypothetical protein